MWQIWIFFYVEHCGKSSAECYVHLVGVDKVMYFGFCASRVHSWQNGTRCRDGGKYCCYSHLVWLVFEGSIPTYAFFIQKTFL